MRKSSPMRTSNSYCTVMNLWTSWRVLFVFGMGVAMVAPIGCTLLNTFIEPLLNRSRQNYPEVFYETDQMVKNLSYPCELHKVTTADGYILKVFRIPYGKSGRGAYSKRPPVLVQHGLLSSSDDFVINNPYQSLGFLLADAGYDVWLSNSRGNKYGLGHTKPIPSEKDFFSFSFDEMAEFDLPSVIDHVLEVTNYKDLQYIGHSMGVTIGLAMLSTKTQYNGKVRHFHALGPVAWLDHIQTPYAFMLPLADEIKFVLDLVHYYNFLPYSDFMKLLALQCDTTLKGFCKLLMDIPYLYNPYELDSTPLSTILAHFPAGTSTQTVVHFAQEIDVSKFQKYDHGIIVNLRKYGRLTPPEYDVFNVSANVSLYWGLNDYIADPLDVARLCTALPNCVDFYKVPNPYYGHVDFAWALDNAHLIYNYLISKLVRY